MSSNPSSFRYPFKLPFDTEPQLANAIRSAFNGLVDHDQAIKALNDKVNANTTGVTAVQQTVATVQTAIAIPPATPNVIGSVNLQPSVVGVTSYITNQSDYGGLIVINSPGAFALTLNSGLTQPWYTTVYNIGAGTVTATPDAGNVNNGASVSIAQTHFATIYFDPTRNFWALIT